MKKTALITRGIFGENPIFRLLLGMCPTLAVTTSLKDALGMGAAATFVLICSNATISFLRALIPDAVRIPCYIVVIATFVTIVELVMQAYLPALASSLGIFIPLIVVNCIILGRAEAFASKNSVADSVVDGLGMGLGFTLSLALIGSVREIIGQGTLTVWGDLEFAVPFSGTTLFVLPAGGFITLGVLMAIINLLQERRAISRGEPPPPPATLDCRHCVMCDFGRKNV